MLAETVAGDIDRRLTLHDFRVVFGDTHTNLIFDLVVPFGYPDPQKLGEEIQRRVQMVDSKLFVVATVEHSYT